MENWATIEMLCILIFKGVIQYVQASLWWVTAKMIIPKINVVKEERMIFSGKM